MHTIRPNRVGFFITGIDDQPVFHTYEEALKWAQENNITIYDYEKPYSK